MERPADDRPYSPGLEGVLAGETALAKVDGANGRLIYRGYPIGELVRAGTYAQVAELLWTGEWPDEAHLPTGRCPSRSSPRSRELPSTANADGCAAHRDVRLGRDQSTELAADRRAGPRADRSRALGAGRVRAAA